MDAQVNGMVNVGLLDGCGGCDSTCHAWCVCAACVCAPMLEQDANLLFFYLLCKVRLE
jgi:hypothetical protein